MTVQITRLLRWISDEEPEVTLLCGSADRAYPRSSTPIQLPGCIADSSYVLVPEMLASGAEKVLIDVESCSCDDFDEDDSKADGQETEPNAPDAQAGSRGEGPSAADQQASRSSLLAQRFNSWRGLLGDRVSVFSAEEPRFRKAEVISAEDPPVSRRAIFGLGGGSSLAIDPTLSDDERLLNALEILGIPAERADEFAPPPESAPLVANGCIACGVCVSACPTGSLELRTTSEASAERTTLVHDRHSCVASGECIKLCPESALSLAQPLSWTDVAQGAVALATLETGKCKKCGATYRLDGHDLCPTCRRKADNPFGYWLPPGFERKNRG